MLKLHNIQSELGLNYPFSNYNKLIVNWPFIDEDKISVYDTVDAKKSYDPNTGRIESQICCNNEKQCDAYDADWIFCEEQ